MEIKRRVKVKWADLEMAMHQPAGEMHSFLDLESGDVVAITDEVMGYLDDPPEEGLAEWQQQELAIARQIDVGGGGRYLAVPEFDSHDDHRTMEDFIGTVADGRRHALLMEWLESEGVEPLNQPPPPDAEPATEHPSPGVHAAAVHHVLTILAVSDLDRAMSFYRDVFGWSARVNTPTYVELALPDGRGFGLYEREGFARNTGRAPVAVPVGQIGGTEIFLHCDHLEATIARIEAAGARKLSDLARRDWGDEAAYYADPDGNVVVVARPGPPSRQGKVAPGD